MIGKLNHVAIVVPDLKVASELYRNKLGANVTEPVDMPLNGVTTVFVKLPNTNIELLHPLGENSPVTNFLERNPSGGLHHVCYEVDDMTVALEVVKSLGIRILGDGEPKPGAHGKPTIFLHPKEFCGTLVELEEI